jgi:hypothetical protein
MVLKSERVNQFSAKCSLNLTLSVRCVALLSIQITRVYFRKERNRKNHLWYAKGKIYLQY